MEAVSADLVSDAPTLSLHFSRAGDDERTWAFGRMAGAAARRAYANADAAAQYELALDAARRLDVPAAERIEAWDTLGELRELAGMLSESIDAYRTAASLAKGDPVSQAQLLANKARVQDRAGAHVAAMRSVSAARALLAGVDTPEARRVDVRLDNLTAVIRLGQEKGQEARRWAVRTVERARDTDDPETLVQALMGIDHADLLLGVPVDGSSTREAFDICVANGFRPRESVASTNLGTYAFFRGDWDQAAEWYRQSKRAALEAGNATGASETDVNLSEILLNRGELAEAETRLVDAVRVLRASQMDWETAYAEMLLARVRLAQGNLIEARRLAEGSVAVFTDLSTRTSAFEASLVRADVVAQGGGHAEALALIEAAETAAKGDDEPLRARACLQKGASLTALGRTDEAAAVVETGLALAREQALAFEEALLLALLSDLAAVTGDAVTAGRARSEANAILTRLGVRA
jgi:tetratricopeptide (TPR) repeat protein